MCATTNTANNSVGEAIGQAAATMTEWYTDLDLARRYQASRRHVHRLADAGKMPWGHKIGNLRRWSRQEIEVWEAGGCKPVRSAKGAAR